MFPTVLKAQQEPTEPWSFTSVTTPLSLQSNESGGATPGVGVVKTSAGNCGTGDGLISTFDLNSKGVRSENWFSSKVTFLGGKHVHVHTRLVNKPSHTSPNTGCLKT